MRKRFNIEDFVSVLFFVCLIIVAIVLPMAMKAQDTLPAILKVQQGNWFKYVEGKVVLTKDCKVIEYLQVNTWKRKERLTPFKGKVVDYRLKN